MLTCIACTKQFGGGTDGAGALHSPPEDDEDLGTPSTRHAIKALTSQIKDMALKASGAYRHCKPCSGTNQQHRHSSLVDSDVASGSERFQYSYRRAGESSSSTPREMILIGKETDGGGLRMGMSSGEGTPSMSGRTEGGVVFVAEENKEWVAQVEPGVLITFLSLPQGGNDLRRIRFSREMFNKWQAQRWWAENYDKVMELYNVQRFNRETTPVAATPKSDDEASPVTMPLTKERLPRNLHHPMNGVMGYLSSDSLDHQSLHAHHHNHSNCLPSTPKLSSISGPKTETSSMDASARTTTSSHEDVERSGELSMSNASDQETEWVEQDEPGVYITIRQLPGGVRELRRVRFSRERFGEMHARLWWEENRARIHEQYL